MKHWQPPWIAIALSVLATGAFSSSAQAAEPVDTGLGGITRQVVGTGVKVVADDVLPVAGGVTGTPEPSKSPPVEATSGAPRPVQVDSVSPGRPVGLENPAHTGPSPVARRLAAGEPTRERAPGSARSSAPAASRPRPASVSRPPAPASRATHHVAGPRPAKAARRSARPQPLRDLVRSIPYWVKAALTLTSLLLVLSLMGVLKSRRELGRALRRAHSDVVTGLPNRAAVDEALLRMTGQAARQRTPLAVAMLDLDHFKEINDSFGHAKGDDALAAVGAAARAGVRSGDFVGRFGGEEFMIVMPDTDEQAAHTVASKLQDAFHEIGILGPNRTITASFGVAGGVGTQEDLQSLIPAADAALYAAKADGRDRIGRASKTAGGHPVVTEAG